MRPASRISGIVLAAVFIGLSANSEQADADRCSCEYVDYLNAKLSGEPFIVSDDCEDYVEGRESSSP